MGWLAVLTILAVLWYLAGNHRWLTHYPQDWIIPLRYWISDFMRWLVREASFGLFTFRELTRAFAWLLDLPLQACLNILARGIDLPLGEGGVRLPPLPWVGVLGAMVYLAWRVGDRGLVILVGCSFGYLAIFGQWQSAMVTLSSILVAVPLGVLAGAGLGIMAYRRRGVEKAITPVLDLMQTVPVFAYLVPVLFLFGFGPVSAMIATIIYAMPPMVRVTLLALKTAPVEVTEFGRMAGCTSRQLMWKILLPASRHSLMVGVNQVIMLSLNMVIIASMIGAGGLGHDVLTALRRLAIGSGLEAGLAITLLAISLDRLSKATAEYQAKPVRLRARHGRLAQVNIGLGMLAIVAASYLVSLALPGGSIPLALARRSANPVLRAPAAILIELVRGVPLVVLLFVTVSVLPLLLGGQPIDKMWLVLTALTLHAATSLAEVWRGGLEAVPDGQMEGATALGLSRWNGFRLVVWPQARRIAMPPAIGTIIGAVKDTSLVLVIGIFDMLGAAKAALADMAWRAHALEIYLAVAAFYFVVCFALSVYAERLRTRPYHS